MLEITFAAITALCSILHGKGDGDDLIEQFWEGKFFIMALHAVLAFALVHPLAITSAAIYWLFLRNGKMARAEIDYILGKTTLNDIRKAYPLGIGYIIAPAISKCTHRRQQEYISGLILGTICYIPLYVYLW